MLQLSLAIVRTASLFLIRATGCSVSIIVLCDENRYGFIKVQWDTVGRYLLAIWRSFESVLFCVL